NLKEKQEIGRLAALEIEDNECIFLDAGSTTLEMIPYIKAQNIVVVTSGLTHVEELIKYGIRTFILGGEIKATTFATVGASALETDRKSTRLNSSHVSISYAVFCLKKKTRAEVSQAQRNYHISHTTR